jgi:glyoxylase-like metal-dependent hydrolase (beta-lactamase superfamily II)
MNVKIHPLTLNFVQAYLIETAGGLFLVDCGMPGNEKKIRQTMQGLGREDLKLIFITHAHPDHTGSAAALKRSSGAKIAIHRLEAEALRTARMPVSSQNRLRRLVTAIIGRFFRVQLVEADILLEDGDSLEPYGLRGTVFHTPGHSPGSCCLVLEDQSGFVGDLVSTSGMPHLQHDIVDDWGQLHASYLRLRELGVERAYPGHGEKSLSGSELVALIDAEIDSIKA